MAKTGVSGTEDLVRAGRAYGEALDGEAREVDSAITGRMLGLMRSRVGKDTGQLLNGITAQVSGGKTTVQATEAKGGVDIARTTEFGRGQRAVADASFFAGAGAKPRAAGKAGGGQPPRPFFLNSAREALEVREGAMDSASDRAARKTGWL